MRMTTAFGRVMMTGAALLALQACGETKQEPEPSEIVNGTEPDLADPASAAADAPPPQSCEATSYCSGPLVVRADNLVLNRTRANQIDLVGTLSFENRSSADVRVALLSGKLVMNTDKGITLEQGNRYTSGLEVCQNDGSECFDASPDTFRLIAPGDSPAKLNVALRGGLEPPQAPLVPQIETGTLTVEAYTVAADGARQVHRIALANVPISNQVTQ
jgi:hypothetical protein